MRSAETLDQQVTTNRQRVVFSTDKGIWANRLLAFEVDRLASGFLEQAYRAGGPILKQAMVSDKNGKWHIQVSSGAPFTIVFYYNQSRIPELQQLAGKDGDPDVVFVVLLTVDERKKLAEQGRAILEEL